MNREEARLELDATTLRPQDASSEARAMAQSDPELGTWLEKRTEFDEQVAAAFASFIPAGLRESILQNARVPAKRPIRWVLPTLAAAAAAVAITWTMLWPVSSDMPAWQAESLAALTKVEYGVSKVHPSRDFEAIKKMLVADHSPTPDHLPGTVGAMPVRACKCIQIVGHAASIICFEIEPGKEAHLVVMDNTDMANLPPQLQPQFKACRNWNTASWSDGKQTFLLATKADVAALKKLFGRV
ncbi:MAG: hypothetical protein B7Z37_27780 [Verrucomicrobia bacterium 12-59-8]|nr:MAG: hypothetical protein B7Z37_27780 [Verrucomicrobia bacterium 12-59-8]